MSLCKFADADHTAWRFHFYRHAVLIHPIKKALPVARQGFCSERFVRFQRLKRQQAIRCGHMARPHPESSRVRMELLESQTNSFLTPMSVRSLSANKRASKGFLNVSLMLDRSKLIVLPSSGSRAMRMISVKSALFRRF